MNRDVENIAAFAFGLLASIAIGMVGLLLVAGLVRYGWNISMPHLLSLPEASYRNALGLVLLAWAVRLPSVSLTKEG